MDQVVRHATSADRPLIVDLLRGFWGGTTVVAHGTLFDAAALPALLSRRGDRVTGLLTYAIGLDGLEVVTLDAVQRHSGAGTALLSAAVRHAVAEGLGRIWLITTNDNVDGIRFYQRRGMRIVGINPGAVDESRKIKPSIPEVGEYGIEIHDELVLERRLPSR